MEASEPTSQYSSAIWLVRPARGGKAAHINLEPFNVGAVKTDEVVALTKLLEKSDLTRHFFNFIIFRKWHDFDDDLRLGNSIGRLGKADYSQAKVRGPNGIEKQPRNEQKFSAGEDGKEGTAEECKDRRQGEGGEHEGASRCPRTE